MSSDTLHQKTGATTVILFKRLLGIQLAVPSTPLMLPPCEMPHENASTAQFNKALSRERETLDAGINSFLRAARGSAREGN